MPKERAKNDRAHDVPLPPAALEMLKLLPRGQSDFVFTSNDRSPISGYSKAKRTLDAGVAADGGAALTHWTFHDIRRTVATNLAKIGVPVHVVEKLLNHASGSIKGVAAVYNRHQYFDERRQALEAWTARLGQIVSGRVSENAPSRATIIGSGSLF